MADTGLHYNFGFAFANALYSNCVLTITFQDSNNPPASIGTHGVLSKLGEDSETETLNSGTESEYASTEDTLRTENGDSESETTDQTSQHEEGDSKSATAKPGACASTKAKRTIHVNTAILSALSPFFTSLFNTVSDHNINLHKEDEAAFFDMLEFMYTGSLRNTETNNVLKILELATKYSVATCIQDCVYKLSNCWTPEKALACLRANLDSTSPKVDRLIYECECYLANALSEMSKSTLESFWNLPSSTIVKVLQRDELEAESEDEILDLILESLTEHRRDVLDNPLTLGELLSSCVRFPMLSLSKLRSLTTTEILAAALSVTDMITLFNSKLFPDIYATEMLAEAPKKMFKRRALACRPLLQASGRSPHSCQITWVIRGEEFGNLSTSSIVESDLFFFTYDSSAKNVEHFLKFEFDGKGYPSVRLCYMKESAYSRSDLKANFTCGWSNSIEGLDRVEKKGVVTKKSPYIVQWSSNSPLSSTGVIIDLVLSPYTIPKF